MLKKKFPVSPTRELNLITLEKWQKKFTGNFLFSSAIDLCLPRQSKEVLQKSFDKTLAGKVKLFNADWQTISSGSGWYTNVLTQYQYDPQQHWSEIADLNPNAGDIKYVWEKSRFGYLLNIMRYDYHFKEDHAAFVWSEIDDFIANNPMNCGPNYICSQEISIRVMNWLFLLYFYRKSEGLTEERFQRIIHSIRWQIRHVYDNLSFSRYSVRNNHVITESGALFVCGCVMSFFPEASKWKRLGKKVFEQEIIYQIYPDGTYLQFSHNYHRTVIQTLTLVLAIAARNNENISEKVKGRADKSLNFLYQCQDLSSGWLPNYGANDGALFYRLNDADYRDFRPQLDALNCVLRGRRLYTEDYEDAHWFTPKVKLAVQAVGITQKEGFSCFPHGGIYLLRDGQSLTVLVCTAYKDRPGQADGLHLDLWHKGENILFDAGSYRYNTDPELIRYFNGVASHNSIALEGGEHMLKGPRFIWFNWIRKADCQCTHSADEWIMKGRLEAYSNINKGIILERTIQKKCGLNHWVVSDRIIKKPANINMVQRWHLRDKFWGILKSTQERQELTGWVSDYYGKKEPVHEIVFRNNNDYIITTIALD